MRWWKLRLLPTKISESPLLAASRRSMNITELKYELIRRGIDPDSYQIDSGVTGANECYCLAATATGWEVYYFEKGQKTSLEIYGDESAACARLIELLERDRLA